VISLVSCLIAILLICFLKTCFFLAVPELRSKKLLLKHFVTLDRKGAFDHCVLFFSSIAVSCLRVVFNLKLPVGS